MIILLESLLKFSKEVERKQKHPSGCFFVRKLELYDILWYAEKKGLFDFDDCVFCIDTFKSLVFCVRYGDGGGATYSRGISFSVCGCAVFDVVFVAAFRWV